MAQRLCHRPARLDHGFVASIQREDIRISHFLRGIAGQRRTESAAAIHDDLGGRIGNGHLQIALQDPLPQMPGLDSMAGVPFVVFTDIQEDGLGIFREPFARLFEGKLADARFGIGGQFQETG